MKIAKEVTVALFAAVCISGAFAKKDAKVTKNRPEIIDYQGMELGIELPEWVKCCATGDSQGTLKALNLSGKQAFILANKGTDLEYLKDWSDHVAVETEVAASITRSVASAVQSSMNQRQDLSETERETRMTQYTASLTAVELNGLLKSAQYWTKSQTLKPGLKKGKKAEDYTIAYSYYVVYTMDQKVFNNQIKAALLGVEDNASEGAKLKEMISNKLQGIVMPSEEE